MKRVKYFLVVIALVFSAMTVNAADTITISKEKATVNVGDTLDLTVTGTDRTPTWTSYNANIAKVDKFGKVTAIRKGNTKVRVRIASFSKLCTVTVVDSSIKLNKRDATLYHGGTSVNAVQLKATVKGASKDITWESSDPGIAVVDANGKVTSVSAGTAIITATANGKSASCPITVKESRISLNMDSLQVSTKGTGSSIKVTPTIIGSKKNVKWETSDKTVATVSGGKVTGKKTGTATITATANGVSASCNVKVTEGLISINEEKILLYAGSMKTDTEQLKTNATKNDVVTWSSSDTNVVTVNEKGLVTPVSAGTAVIGVECDGKTDTCIVTVKQTSTNIAEDSILLKTKGTDKTHTLNKQIVGKTASVKWTTSNNKIATVSNGKVTAKKAGTATITATANGVSDTVTVNVVDYDPTIRLNQQEYTLYTVKGNTVTLKATVDGPSKAVTWASSDTSVATVTNKGKVTAVSAGTATISASANGVTAECIVDVTESAVVLDSYSVSLDKGEKSMIGYDIIGTSQSVKWATTNSKISTVSKGVITAKNYGETDIKVTANGVTSICHVNVTNCKHDYKNTVTLEPTCGTEGIRTFTCTLCGDTYTEAIPATGKHNFAWVTVKDADCITDGIKEYKCRVCEYAEKEDIIPALGHDWADWVIVVAPTEEMTGVKTRICNRCKLEEKTELPWSDHVHDYSFNTTVVEPGCINDGGTIHYCTCGDSYTDNVVKALGHDFTEWTVTKEATTDEPGLKARTCTRCQFEETEIIPILTHEHDFVAVNTVTPTCTENGYTKYKCSICNEIKRDDVIPAKGHTYINTVVEPACESGGYTEHTCSVCGDSFKDNLKDALGHTPSDWICSGSCTPEVAEAITGTEYKECIVCKTILESHPITITHQYEWITTKEATCEADGEKVDKCSVCGRINQTLPISKLPHSWTDWEITKEPADGVHKTRSDFGTRTCHCTVCGKIVEESIVRIAIEDGQSKEVYGIFLDDDARTTLDMVNNLRATEKNLKPYQWQEQYEDLCYIRAAEISYSYDHSRPSGEERNVIMSDGSVQGTGENIAMGYTSAAEAYHGWDLSPGHHANMVNEWCVNYCCKGFIIDNTASSPYHYWVQLFGGYREEGDRYLSENGSSMATSECNDIDSNEETGDTIETTGAGDDNGNGEGDVNRQEETYTIKYAVASMTDTNEYKLGDIATILEYIGDVPDNMELIGWGINDTDTVPSYQPGDQIEMTASLRLVPIFVNKETGDVDYNRASDSAEISETLENAETSETQENFN